MLTKLNGVALFVMGMSSMGMAEIKYDVGGEGVFYYQTNNAGDNKFLDQESSSASSGLELDANVDFGNDLLIGTQGTFLGTLGLEKWMISNSRQNAKVNDRNDVALTKLFISKQISNTFVKLGRQELDQSISPFAFSESWNVFTNRFDAAIIKNTDIPDTQIIASYVDRASQHNGLNHFDDLSIVNTAVSDNSFEKGAYFITAVNESVKGMPITGSYYKFKGDNSTDTDVLWGDIKLNQSPIKVAFQAGKIDPTRAVKETKAYGAKLSTDIQDTKFSLAYSSVNDGDAKLKNFGTGIKTPLYTQMIGNQNFISSDADSFVIKGVSKVADGKLIIQYDKTKDNSVNKNNYQELDVVYKFKALNMNMLLAYIGQKADKATFAGEKDANNLRFWTRYNF